MVLKGKLLKVKKKEKRVAANIPSNQNYFLNLGSCSNVKVKNTAITLKHT
jgi:hypothetical protein